MTACLLGAAMGLSAEGADTELACTEKEVPVFREELTDETVLLHQKRPDNGKPGIKQNEREICVWKRKIVLSEPNMR